MNEHLPLSMIRLDTLHPESSDWYKQPAHELEHRGLRAFNKSLTDTTGWNAVPRFLFLSLLALDFLVENLAHKDYDLDSTLLLLVECPRLCRGVRRWVKDGSQRFDSQPMILHLRATLGNLSRRPDTSITIWKMLHTFDLNLTSLNDSEGAKRAMFILVVGQVIGASKRVDHSRSF